jgi:hypothetical protein
MYSVIAAAVAGWIAGVLFLIFGSLSAIMTVCVVAYLILLIALPVGVILLMRRLSKSPMIIRLSGEGQEKWYPCPDCSGGAQLNGKPIPASLHRDKGRDEQGPYFQSRDANVMSCTTCAGRGRLFTMTSNVENGVV